MQIFEDTIKVEKDTSFEWGGGLAFQGYTFREPESVFPGTK